MYLFWTLYLNHNSMVMNTGIHISGEMFLFRFGKSVPTSEAARSKDALSAKELPTPSQCRHTNTWHRGQQCMALTPPHSHPRAAIHCHVREKQSGSSHELPLTTSQQLLRHFQVHVETVQADAVFSTQTPDLYKYTSGNYFLLRATVGESHFQFT